MNKIKVLVVDDSALMRKVISDMINSQYNMEVIDTARNGEDFFKKLYKNIPQVITLDVEMPVMDGIMVLEAMKEKGINIPVIVLSSISKKSSELTMECLEKGAFDFLPKPSGAISLDIDTVKDELITKIKLAYEKNQEKSIEKETNMTRKVNNINKLSKIEAVVIGASTGGPRALYNVITNLPEDLNVPVFVVQHMPATFTKAFSDRLNVNSKLKVVEAQDKELIEKNVVYVAPGGFHMELRNDKRIHLNTGPTIWGVRPAVDKLFISAAQVYKDRLLSVVLTGMGKDGAQGTVEVKKHNGITISEDKSTCTIYGMPKAAFETGMVDVVLPLSNISDEIIKIVRGNWR
ncbi:protein-glutamate methylesterase/protein-glutamine glutaminase [Clostridium rectalis]|uniref:protein-glutamate methylesterase/protein-glutamine glutaminase n=1 Tax=Clostridium rectalis TaxID=2040295 RepID=UPI000F63ACA8|nr:chemotaxis response regulator protein-glutamate methylesterase [Clostridium rectalis]